MPTTTANTNYVKEQTKVQGMRNTAADTALQASGIEGQAYVLNDEVMKAVQADRQSRGVSKIATDVGNTMGQLVSDPEGIRNRTRGMVDPGTVNNLTYNTRAFNLQTLGEQATQQELNQGSLDKVIQAGANQMLAKAQQMKAQAAQDEAKANALMESLQFQQSEDKRTFDEWLAREQLKLSGSGGIDLSGLFDTGNDDGFIPDGPADPQMSPVEGEGTISPDRKYIFKNGQWEPYQEPGFWQSFLGSLFSPKVGKAPEVRSGSSSRAAGMQRSRK